MLILLPARNVASSLLSGVGNAYGKMPQRLWPTNSPGFISTHELCKLAQVSNIPFRLNVKGGDYCMNKVFNTFLLKFMRRGLLIYRPRPWTDMDQCRWAGKFHRTWQVSCSYVVTFIRYYTHLLPFVLRFLHAGSLRCRSSFITCTQS